MKIVIAEIVSLTVSFLLAQTYSGIKTAAIALIPAVFGIILTERKGGKGIAVSTSAGYIVFWLASLQLTYESDITAMWVFIYALIIIAGLFWDNKDTVTIEERVPSYQRRHDPSAKDRINVLFLDYDGVINLITPDHRFIQFDRACIDNVSKLCRQFDLKIVVSSSWRYDDDYDQLLYSHGLGSDVEVIGCTDSLGSREREIMDYLDRNPQIDRFIILDDLPMNELRNYQVLTRMHEGFSERRYNEAAGILNRQQ